MKIASFDIIDTTLIRKCGRPENVFHIMGRHLYPYNEGKQNSFYMWRLNAEQKAIKHFNKDNLNICEIYSTYEQVCGRDFNTRYLEELEQQIESQQLVHNLKIKETIAEKRKKGYKICFISDMYLHCSFLKSILIREECACEEDDVFVSCEYNKRKSNGQLYDFIKSYYENIEEWTHYGDNYDSDVVQCKRKGIKPVFVDTSLNPTEKAIESTWRIYPFGRSLSVLIGFQRCARLHLAVQDINYNNAADYVASAYIPYLLYVMKQASTHQIKRLYFLSRDAYIMYKMADVIKNNYKIECKFLFLSRKALALPLLSEISPAKIESITGGSLIGKKVEDIIELFKLDDMGFCFPFSTIETEEQISVFTQTLISKGDVISQRQQEQKTLLNKYLANEGVFDKDTNIAMVDLGWLGTTRLMLNELRRENNLDNIPFFYFGCRIDVLDRCFGDYFVFLPFEYCNHDRTIITESYYSVSEYPTTLGYRQDKETVSPLFGVYNEFDKQLADIHVTTCKTILSYMTENESLFDDSSLSIWGNQYIDFFESHPQYIDYSSLRKLKSSEKGYVIEHIPLKKLLRYLFNGCHIGNCLTTNSIFDTYGIILREKYSLKKIAKNLIKRLQNVNFIKTNAIE